MGGLCPVRAGPTCNSQTGRGLLFFRSALCSLYCCLICVRTHRLFFNLCIAACCAGCGHVWGGPARLRAVL